MTKNRDDVLGGLSKKIFCGDGRKRYVVRIKGNRVRNSFLSASCHETPNTSVMLDRRSYVPTIRAVETPGGSIFGTVMRYNACTRRSEGAFVEIEVSKQVGVS